MKRLAYLLIRYSLIVLLGIGNLWLIYLIFTPLTIVVSKALLGNLFTEIVLIKSCIAGAAYYLILILNLSLPMSFNQRIKSILLGLVLFFIINIIRIVTFTYLFVYDISYAKPLHKLTWYFGSTLFIILIWFASVKLFNIKSIPFYTDFKYIKSTF